VLGFGLAFLSLVLLNEAFSLGLKVGVSLSVPIIVALALLGYLGVKSLCGILTNAELLNEEDQRATTVKRVPAVPRELVAVEVVPVQMPLQARPGPVPSTNGV
jgi:hypothetical protein